MAYCTYNDGSNAFIAKSDKRKRKDQKQIQSENLSGEKSDLYIYNNLTNTSILANLSYTDSEDTDNELNSDCESIGNEVDSDSDSLNEQLFPPSDFYECPDQVVEEDLNPIVPGLFPKINYEKVLNSEVL